MKFEISLLKNRISHPRFKSLYDWDYVKFNFNNDNIVNCYRLSDLNSGVYDIVRRIELVDFVKLVCACFDDDKWEYFDTKVYWKIKNTITKENKIMEEKNKEVTNENLDESLEELKQELCNEKGKYIRLSADFENYKKRTEKEKENSYANYMKKSLLDVTLPLMDTLEWAMLRSEDSIGFMHVINQLKDNLKKIGCEQMDVNGKLFNPEFHDAVSRISRDKLDYFVEPNTIIDVVSNGYIINGTIIRHPKVVVAI